MADEHDQLIVTPEELAAQKEAAAATKTKIDPLAITALIDSNTAITFKVTQAFVEYFDLIQPVYQANYYDPKRKPKAASAGTVVRDDPRPPIINRTQGRKILLKGRYVRFLREDKTEKGNPKYMSCRVPTVMNINCINFWVVSAFSEGKRPKHFIMPSGVIYIVEPGMVLADLGSVPNFSKGATA